MKILVLGAGRMGLGAAYDLAHNSPQVASVTIADTLGARAFEVARTVGAKVTAVELNVSRFDETVALMRGHDAVISCVTYVHNLQLARAAIAAQVNFCDLGGNNTIVDQQLALGREARAAGINIIPDCGLAPGMVSVLTAHGAVRFDQLDAVRIRVGGLPLNPVPPLDYQIVFSVEGLINEYVEPARIIRDGKVAQVESMTEIERLQFDGPYPEMEAFHTSGGTSTLPDTLRNSVRNLDYKTIRYLGHCDKFKTMLDLGLASSAALDVNGVQIEPRQLLAQLLTQHLPSSGPDLVFIRLEFEGTKDGAASGLRFDIVDQYDANTHLSAMMRTTAFPASIVAQMMARSETLMRGAIPQELAIPPIKFVAELERRGIVITESAI